MANENEKNFGYNIDLSTYKDDLESLWNSAINDIQQGDLEILHKHNKNGSISGVYDNNIVEYIKHTEYLFFLGGTPYIFSNGVYRPDRTGSLLKGIIKSLMFSEFINAKTINRIYDLFAIDSELQVTYDELNKYPPYSVPFKNGLYDALNKQFYNYSDIGMDIVAGWRIINQIPFNYSKQEAAHNLIDEWLDFICVSPDDKEMLLQFAGLALTHDNRFQKFMMIKGKGGNGKSVIIDLIAHTVGKENTSFISLEDITGKNFEVINLLGKSFNCCGDIKSKPLEDITQLKKLTGEDEISARELYKMSVSFKNYAKLMFSANEIPLIMNERSDAFYRRLLVFEIKKKPDKIDINLLSKLKEQTEGFIWLCLRALERLYQNGVITESDNSKRLLVSHRCYSDSVAGFIAEEMIEDENAKTPAADINKAYKEYCKENDRQPLGRNAFYKALEDKGYDRVIQGRFFKGLQFKPGDWEPAQGKLPFD